MAKINLKNLLSLSAGLIIVAPSTVSILSNINTPVNNPINNQQIVDEINQVKTYQIMMFIKTGETVATLKARMLPEFIQEQLTGEIKSAFKPSAFYFKDFIYNDRSLEDSALVSFGIIEAEIKYDYGSFKNQTTKLVINKTLSAENINQAIQNVSEYKKSITVNDNNSVKKLEINGKFIQDHLEDNANQAIVPDLFSVNNIIYDGRVLEDSDLTIEQKIVTTVDYNYDNFSGKIKLTINITPKNK